jgi:hypothetical protein
MEFDTSDVELDEGEIPIEIEDVDFIEITRLDIGRLETQPDAVPVVIEDNWCAWPRRAA